MCNTQQDRMHVEKDGSLILTTVPAGRREGRRPSGIFFVVTPCQPTMFLPQVFSFAHDECPDNHCCRCEGKRAQPRSAFKQSVLAITSKRNSNAKVCVQARGRGVAIYNELVTQLQLTSRQYAKHNWKIVISMTYDLRL